jgi:hypothetical protein
MRQAVTVHQAVKLYRLGKLSCRRFGQSSQEILQQAGFVV